jgi:hypothetical protein
MSLLLTTDKKKAEPHAVGGRIDLEIVDVNCHRSRDAGLRLTAFESFVLAS